VSLYAEYLILYISNPVESIPHLLDMLQGFGAFSGYKLNLTKSVLLPINQLAEGIGYANFLFKVEHQVFTYLGIKVTCSFKAMFNLSGISGTVASHLTNSQ
jgi:hypothetical protein